jgi:hypothetical protein
VTFLTLTFGDLATGVWGALGDLGESDARFALLGEWKEPGHNADAGIKHATSADAWFVSGPGIELECAAASEASTIGEGFDQLVTVRGELTVQGSAREIECLGRRGIRAIDTARFEAVRDVSCWFGPDLGFALVASRPSGAAGHADDIVTASAFEDGLSLRVLDPRLSTTYTATGQPTRASLELWIERRTVNPDGTGGGRDPDDDEAREPYPRRAAGEALGGRGTASNGAFDVQAAPFLWHARGREGAGLYLLARLK